MGFEKGEDVTEELKPVNCGCGGEAMIEKMQYPGEKNWYGVICQKCLITTGYKYASETEAVKAWNTAMSADKIEFLAEYAWGLQTDPGPECAAPWNPDRNRYCCEFCGHYVGKYDAYCGGCGARLTDYTPEGRGKK